MCLINLHTYLLTYLLNSTPQRSTVSQSEVVQMSIICRAILRVFFVRVCKRNFWSVVTEMPVDLQKQVLLFTTGSDRIPVGGVSEMMFKITRVDNVNM